MDDVTKLIAVYMGKGDGSIFQESYPRLNVLPGHEYSPFPCKYILRTNTNIRVSFLNESIPYFLKARSKVSTT